MTLAYEAVTAMIWLCSSSISGRNFRNSWEPISVEVPVKTSAVLIQVPDHRPIAYAQQVRRHRQHHPMEVLRCTGERSLTTANGQGSAEGVNAVLPVVKDRPLLHVLQQFAQHRRC